jgi:hypothetical protein
MTNSEIWMFLAGSAVVGLLIGWFLPNEERRKFNAQMKAFKQDQAIRDARISEYLKSLK